MDLRIGITADFRSSLFANGINQNALYLAMVYQDMGADVNVIGSSNTDHAAKELKELGVDSLNIVDIKTAVQTTYDVIISLGFIIERSWYNIWKAKNENVKIVAYKCGNELFTDMEAILFEAHGERAKSFNNLDVVVPDQIWVIPQNENTNLDYYSYLLKQDHATVVPFVWDPIVTENYKRVNGYSDWTERPMTRAGIMEPNISVFKNLLMPVVILDRYIREGGEITQIHSFSTKKLSTNKRLIGILKAAQSGLISMFSADPRIPTLKALNNYVDFVVSWQNENPLNYLYFDISWAGWPIIHNAHLCQDIGYYYPDQDSRAAQQQIQNAKDNHNTGYRIQQRQNLKRYTRRNPELIEQYRMLTERLVNNEFKRYTYDWQKNRVD
jgi:acyl carrier protein